MIRITTLFLTLLACLQISVAQKPILKISPEIKLSKSKSFESHLFSNESGHFMYFYEYEGGMFGGGSSTTVLEKYDQKFNLVFSKEYKADRKGISSLGMRYFNGRFVWLFSEKNSKEDYIRYSILPIDLTGKQGKPTDIAKFKYERRDDIPKSLWSISKDSSKLLFRAVSDADNDDEKFGIFMSVLDQNLSTLWSRKVNLNYTEEQVDVLSTVLKNDGSVYLLAKVYEGKKAKESKKDSKKKSVEAYDIVLFQFNKDEEQPKEYRLRLGDSFIKGASLTTGNHDDLKCAGFFSNTKNGSLQGVFYLELAPDGSVTATSKKEFTVADLKKFGEKNTDKDKGGDEGLENTFRFSDFLVREDGSAIVVAEEYFVVVRTTYNGRTSTTTTYYHANDIIVFTISAKGEVERVSAIPKRQVGVNTSYFVSYVSMIKDNDVVFFYNEDEDNMGKPVSNPKPKLVNKFNDCVAVMTTLTPDGKLTRKQLFEAKDDNIESLFVPNDSSPFEKNKLFFVSLKPKLFGKSNFHIGTVTLP